MQRLPKYNDEFSESSESNLFSRLSDDCSDSPDKIFSDCHVKKEISNSLAEVSAKSQGRTEPNVVRSSNKRKQVRRASEELEEPVNKESKAWDMMKRMGYSGAGLGAKSQGRIEPIVAKTPTGRLGLGIKDEDLGIETPDTIWKHGMDAASADGAIIYQIDTSKNDLAKMDLEGGKMIGEKRNTIKDETTYCDENLLHEMLKCKSVLDKYSNFLDPRTRSNPYEKIGKGIFLNRAAMKMMELDYLMEGLFTKTEDNGTLYFADICAGPGGFSEYVLWKRPMTSVGFGFTLRGSNDFNMREIAAGPSCCLHPSYGARDDGDITAQDNLVRFQQDVMNGTDNRGVHTVMADGGFSVESQESIQEILSKQLYLCQFLCAIHILRHGGNFVCKLFDTFTDFTIGLIHLMSTLFSEISIIKPVTSRPANSERYIVFRDFTDATDQIDCLREYLCSINNILNELKIQQSASSTSAIETDNPSSEGERDVLKLLPQCIINRDFHFCQFIKDANNKILRQQIIALAKLEAFIKDANLIDDRQLDIRNELFQRWGITDLRRENLNGSESVPAFQQLININYRGKIEGVKDPLRKDVTILTKQEMMKDKFVFRNMYAGFLGPSNLADPNADDVSLLYVLMKERQKCPILIYDAKDQASLGQNPSRFSEKFEKCNLQIPRNTILLVNFSITFSGKGNQRHKTFIVVDAAMIYGEDISQLSYRNRMEKVANMCHLLDPKKKGIIQPLDFFPFIEFHEFLSHNIAQKTCKGAPIQDVVKFRNSQHYTMLHKMILINFTTSDWMLAHSRSRDSVYYFNVKTKCSQFDAPDDLYGNYQQCSIHEVKCKTVSGEFSCATIYDNWNVKVRS